MNHNGLTLGLTFVTAIALFFLFLNLQPKTTETQLAAKLKSEDLQKRQDKQEKPNKQKNFLPAPFPGIKKNPVVDAQDIKDPVEREAVEILGYEIAQHVASFFHPPQLDEGGDYLVQPQPVTWASNCGKAGYTHASFHDLRDEVEDGIGFLRGDIPLAEDFQERGLQLQSLNQFYRGTGEKTFFQMTLAPRKVANDVRYEVVLTACDNHYLTKCPGNQRLYPANTHEIPSLTEALAAMDRLKFKFQRDSVSFGTRGLVYYNDDVSVELTGGKVSSYNSQEAYCTSFGKKTFCHCKRVL